MRWLPLHAAVLSFPVQKYNLDVDSANFHCSLFGFSVGFSKLEDITRHG